MRISDWSSDVCSSDLFVKRNGEFTVNIALVEDGEVLFGVIQAPVTGALWHGARGQGAFRREGDADVALRTRVPAQAPLRVAASRSHRNERTEALLARIPEATEIGRAPRRERGCQDV